MSKLLKKQLWLKTCMVLYQLSMEEGIDIRDHLNVFNRLVSQLSGVQTKIKEKDEAKLMLTPLPPLYDTLVTILLVGKETLTLEHQEANE